MKPLQICKRELPMMEKMGDNWFGIGEEKERKGERGRKLSNCWRLKGGHVGGVRKRETEKGKGERKQNKPQLEKECRVMNR
jgi:hypothetical protein